MTKINPINFNKQTAQPSQLQASNANKLLFEFDVEPYGDIVTPQQDIKTQNGKPKLDRQGYPIPDGVNLKLDNNYENGARYEYTVPATIKAGKLKKQLHLEDRALRRAGNNIYDDTTDIEAGTVIYFYKNNVIRQYEVQWDKNGLPIADGKVLTAEKIEQSWLERILGAEEKIKYTYMANGDESYVNIRENFHIKNGCYSKNNGFIGDANDKFEKDKKIIFYSEDIIK